MSSETYDVMSPTLSSYLKYVVLSVPQYIWMILFIYGLYNYIFRLRYWQSSMHTELRMLTYGICFIATKYCFYHPQIIENIYFSTGFLAILICLFILANFELTGTEDERSIIMRVLDFRILLVFTASITGFIMTMVSALFWKCSLLVYLDFVVIGWSIVLDNFIWNGWKRYPEFCFATQLYAKCMTIAFLVTCFLNLVTLKITSHKAISYINGSFILPKDS